MLTIKQLTDDIERVSKGLEKKHFKDTQATIKKVIKYNDQRKEAQAILDQGLAEVKTLSKSIGQLMKKGETAEAEALKEKVAALKAENEKYQNKMLFATEVLEDLLYTIPNLPNDSVPEGKGADDNVVERTGGHDVELPKDALPHWELAKKYDIIDFELGVKITGAGFPVIPWALLIAFGRPLNDEEQLSCINGHCKSSFP